MPRCWAGVGVSRPELCLLKKGPMSYSAIVEARAPLREAPASRPRGAIISLLLLGFALLVAVKMPFALTTGRLWAEDGRLYFAYAWSHEWMEALFAQHIGYLSIVPNAATVFAANLASLENAPILIAVVALAVQVLPAALLPVSGIPWLRHPVMLAAGFVLVLIPPGASEAWLNTATSQFHLMLCVGIVLASDVRRGMPGVLQCGSIVLAGLSGPGAAFVTPLFALRALGDRSWPRTLQTALLAATAILQVAIHFSVPIPLRQVGLSPALLIAIVYVQHILLPLVGQDIANHVTAEYREALLAGIWPRRATLLAPLAFAGLVVASLRADRRHAAWMVAGGMTFMVLSYIGSLGDKSVLVYPGIGGRYALAPTVLFSLSLLGILACGSPFARSVAGIVLAACFIAGCGDYLRVPEIMKHGPSWAGEVAAWRLDPSRPLQIWPYGWEMKLLSPASQVSPYAR
jgi:hypothetical protein